MEEKEVNLIDEELDENTRVFNDYIDVAYYYFNKNAELVCKNLEVIEKDEPSAIIGYFHPVVNGVQLTKEQIYTILKECSLKNDFDLEVYIHDVITNYNERRFYDREDSLSVGVINKYGDVVYYNKEKLEFLRELFGSVRDKNVRKEVEKIKENAMSKNKVFQRLGLKIGADYSLAEHIEYKYYLNLFCNAFKIQEEYEQAKLRDESSNVKTMSKLEFAELRITQDILKSKHTRRRK